MTKNLNGIMWMLAFVATDAVILNIGRHIVNGIHITQLIFIGNGTAAILFYLLVKQQGLKIKSTRPKLHFARVVIELFAAALMFGSLAYMQASEVKAILFLMPIFASIAAIFLLGEPSKLSKWISLMAGFVGVMIILRPDVEVAHYGPYMAFGAAVLYSGGVTILKKTSDFDHPFIIGFYFTGLTAAMALPITLMFWQPIYPEILIWTVIMGSIFFLAHVTITIACSKAQLVVLAPIIFIGLIFTALISYFVFGEVPGQNVFLGGFIIIIAATYNSYKES